MHGDSPALVDEWPGLRSLHQAFVIHELIERARGPMRGNIGRAGDKHCGYRADTSSDQAGVWQNSRSDRGIEAFGNEIDETVAVGRMDVQQRMATSKLGKDRCDKGWPARQGCRDAKKSAHR